MYDGRDWREMEDRSREKEDRKGAVVATAPLAGSPVKGIEHDEGCSKTDHIIRDA